MNYIEKFLEHNVECKKKILQNHKSKQKVVNQESTFFFFFLKIT